MTPTLWRTDEWVNRPEFVANSSGFFACGWGPGAPTWGEISLIAAKRWAPFQ